MSKWIVFIGFFLILLAACSDSCQLSPQCSLEPDPGTCYAYFPKYYYDTEEGLCKEFIWGGCDGVVPFESMEACQEVCKCSD